MNLTKRMEVMRYYLFYNYKLMEKKEMISFIYAQVADKTFKYGLNIIRDRNNMCKEKVVSIKALNDGRFRLETFVPSNFNQY